MSEPEVMNKEQIITQGIALAGQTCTVNEAGQTKYCENGCCGRSPVEHCCEVTVWIIVLGAVGGVVVIGIFVAVMCCCVMKKRYFSRGKTAPSQSVSDAARSNASMYRKDSLKSPYTTKQGPKRPPPLPLFFGKGPTYITKRGQENKLPPVRVPAKPQKLEPNIDHYHLTTRRPSYPYPHVLHIDQKLHGHHESGLHSPGHHSSGYNSSNPHSPAHRSLGRHSPAPHSPGYQESSFQAPGHFESGLQTSGNHGYGHHDESGQHESTLHTTDHRTQNHHENEHHVSDHHVSDHHMTCHHVAGHHVTGHPDSGPVEHVCTQSHYLYHDLEPKDIV